MAKLSVESGQTDDGDGVQSMPSSGRAIMEDCSGKNEGGFVAGSLRKL
jgi:hypothetical protein